MMEYALSILVTNNPYLDPRHLALQVDAFNRQTRRDFQVFYLNQEARADALVQATARADYHYHLIDLPFPWLAGTCCWDMVSVTGRLLDQPLHGPYLTYLHKECLPAPDFVASLLSGIAASEAVRGPDAIYRLNQLRCVQTIDQLGALWPHELARAAPVGWIDRSPYTPTASHQLRPWQEDAFALPVDLARRTGLFGCVSFPLFFQDLFDIFHQLPQLPGFEQLSMVHLGEPVIWHLNHPRHFMEYRRAFLQEVRRHPELFGHLALYVLASEDFDYLEDFSQGERVVPAHLHRFVHYMRHSERGTVSLWRQALLARAGLM